MLHPFNHVYHTRLAEVAEPRRGVQADHSQALSSAKEYSTAFQYFASSIELRKRNLRALYGLMTVAPARYRTPSSSTDRRRRGGDKRRRSVQPVSRPSRRPDHTQSTTAVRRCLE